MTFKIGADPELFIINTKSGQLVSAEGIIPGTKEDPMAVESGAVQVDGLAAEFNINPASSEEEFIKNTTTVMTQLREMIKLVDKDLDFHITPFAEFDMDYFINLPPHTKVLGCDPDWNIHGYANEMPANADHPIRTAAGHIHIGFTEDAMGEAHFGRCLKIAQHFYQADLPWWICSDIILQSKRLEYYGMEGSFREKTYGVELRSPDNSWIKSEESMGEMYRRVLREMENLGDF